MLTTDLTIPLHHNFLKIMRACVLQPGVQQQGFHSSDPAAQRFGKGRLVLFAVPSVLIQAEYFKTSQASEWCSVTRLCALREWVTVKAENALECLGRSYWIGRPCAWTYRIGDGQPKTLRFIGDWIFLCSSDQKLGRVPDRQDRLAPNRTWFRSDTRVISAIHRSMRCECYVLTPGGFNELDRIEREVEQVISAMAKKAPTYGSRKRAFLKSLFDNGAFDPLTRVTTEFIAGQLADSSKHLAVELKKDGWIETRRGSGGGIWLTPNGRIATARIFAAGKVRTI